MKIKKSAAPAALKPNDKVTSKTANPQAVTTPAAKASPPAAKTAAPATAKAPAPPAPKPPSPPTSKTATPAATKSPPATLTTIDVKLDVGFGNAVFLRGQGGGLTWERGIPLACVDGKTWRWSGTVKDPLTFKLLINDQIWSAGQDLTVKPGQKLEVAPSFA